jgi:hypothetical protein
MLPQFSQVLFHTRYRRSRKSGVFDVLVLAAIPNLSVAASIIYTHFVSYLPTASFSHICLVFRSEITAA